MVTGGVAKAVLVDESEMAEGGVETVVDTDAVGGLDSGAAGTAGVVTGDDVTAGVIGGVAATGGTVTGEVGGSTTAGVVTVEVGSGLIVELVVVEEGSADVSKVDGTDTGGVLASANAVVGAGAWSPRA